jgi:NRPS condensation-like uncharacterized protein
MTTVSIPARFPATANDVSTHVMRSFSQHLELGCRLSFDGRLDPDVLRGAVRLSLDAEPVLGCALRAGTFRSWWERLDDLDERVPFSVFETDDPDAESVRFQTATMDGSGLPVAVRLLRSLNGDDVSIAVSHDVADGRGVKQYAYLLAELYTRLLGDPAYTPRPDLAARPRAQDVWDRLTAEQRSDASRAPSMTMPNWTLPSTGATGRGRTLRELRVSPETFRAVREYGSARGATVNALLLTAFFRAVTRVYPPPAGQAMSLPFTVDYRRYLDTPEETPIANLAVSIWLGVAQVPEETFDDTLSRVGGQLSAWRDAMWGVKGLMQAASMAKLGYGPTKAMMGAIMRLSAKSGKTSPVFTNVGILDEGRLAFGGLVPVAACLSGPASFGASLVPTISTYRDGLTVSMGFCAEDMDPEGVASVLRFLGEELDTLVAQ